MGCFSVADGVTRLDIRADTPVVGFLIAAGQSYPYRQNPTSAPLYPAELYELVSLPIFGRYDEYGGLTVEDDSQLAVKLALLQTGSANWETLQRDVLHAHDKGFQFMGKPVDEKNPTANIRHYGIFIVTREVYDHLISTKYYREQELEGSVADWRAKDVGAVAEAVSHYIRLSTSTARESFTEAERMQHYETMNVASLGSSFWTDAEGVEHPMPRLASMRQSDSGLGSDLWTAIREAKLSYTLAYRKPALHAIDDVPEYRELLGLLWDTQRFLVALRVFKVIITPALRTGFASFGSSFDLNLLSMQYAWEHWEEELRDYSAHPTEALKPRLEQMRALTARMEKLFASLD